MCTTDEKRRMIELWEAGKSVNEIAKEVHKTTKVVKDVLHSVGIPEFIDLYVDYETCIMNRMYVIYQKDFKNRSCWCDAEYELPNIVDAHNMEDILPKHIYDGYKFKAEHLMFESWRHRYYMIMGKYECPWWLTSLRNMRYR